VLTVAVLIPNILPQNETDRNLDEDYKVPFPQSNSNYTSFFALKGQCILTQGKVAVFFNTDAAALGTGDQNEPAAL